ncbi:MAG: PAS domain S-box protein, partial [bacterium]
MNTKNGEHVDSADPLVDSSPQDVTGQDSSPLRQSSREQTEQTLRRRAEAEALVWVEEAATDSALSAEEAGRLLHELQVHEIEMEMQNEELRRTQVELEASRAQYLELYEQAPVGYLTLNGKGLVLKANLTTANMLGVKRDALVLQPLSHFILYEDQTLYYLQRKKLFETRAPMACELRMVKEDGTIFWALLEATAAQDDAGSSFFLVTLSDIAQQKRAEEALQKSLTLHSGLIETTDTGFVILDKTGNVVNANEEYVRLSGHQHLGQILGRNVVEWTAEYEKERNAEAVGQCLREGQIRNLEIDYVNAQGKITPIEINSTVVTVDGAPQILTLCRDITERKRAEEALRTSEVRYRQLVENANEAILVIQDGMPKFANRMAGELTGYSLQELGLRPFPEFIHPDDRGMVVERHLARLKGDLSSPRYAFRLIAHDGSFKWVEIDAVLIDWEGKPATLNFLTDIAERKQAEDALRESEMRFRTLAASAQDAIIMINEGGKISFWNKAAQVIFGWSEDEILEKNLHEIIMPEDNRAVFTRAFEAFQSTGSGTAVGKTTELQGLRKDGTGVPLELSLSAVQIGNSWQGIGIVRDITDRKRVEETLQEANSYLNSLIDYANAPIIVWDPAFRITRFNHAFENLTGFSAPEVLGKEIRNLFPEDTRQESLGHIYSTETGQRWESVEIPIQRKDGAVKMVLWNSATLYGA